MEQMPNDVPAGEERKQEGRKSSLKGWSKWAAALGLGAAAMTGASSAEQSKPEMEKNVAAETSVEKKSTPEEMSPTALLAVKDKELQALFAELPLELQNERDNRLAFLTGEANTDQIDFAEFSKAVKQKVEVATLQAIDADNEEVKEKIERINKEIKDYYEKYTKILEGVKEVKAEIGKVSGLEADKLKEEAAGLVSKYKDLLKEVERDSF